MPTTRKRKSEIVPELSQAAKLAKETDVTFLDLPDDVLAIIITLAIDSRSSIRRLSSRFYQLTKLNDETLHIRSACSYEIISSLLTSNIRELTLAAVTPLLLQTITRACPQLNSLSVFHFTGALNSERILVNRTVTKLVMRPCYPKTSAWRIPDWVFPKLPSLTTLHLSQSVRMSAPELLRAVASLPVLEKLTIDSPVMATVELFHTLFSSLRALRELELASVNWKNRQAPFEDAVLCIAEFCPQFESFVIRDVKNLFSYRSNFPGTEVVRTLLEKLPRFHTFWVPGTLIEPAALGLALSQRLQRYHVHYHKLVNLGDGESFATYFPNLTHADCAYSDVATSFLGCDRLYTLELNKLGGFLYTQIVPVPDLRVFPALRKLTVHADQAISILDILTILEYAPNLEYLAVNVPTPWDQQAPESSTRTLSFPALKTLKFSGRGSDDSSRAFNFLFGFLPNLEKLFIVKPQYSSSPAFIPSQPMPSLSLLDVSVDNSHNACQGIAAYCPNLRELRLFKGSPDWSWKKDPDTFACINDEDLTLVLRSCPFLRRLIIDDCRLLTSVGKSAIFKFGHNLDVVMLQDLNEDDDGFVPVNARCMVFVE